MRSEKITDVHLSRTAYVYVRQSSAQQVMNNTESTDRQYALATLAGEWGFKQVEVIDDDLALSGTESSKRHGFQRLVAAVSVRKAGIVIGLEVSRLARNNKDWYHLLDLCSLFDTLIADQDGVYNPADPNDRMLLGLKGTMSEVEIHLLKNRLLAGARNKAKRGELIYRLPVGYVKTEGNRIEKDPDKRVQETVEKVFIKFQQTLSARQTHLWFVQEEVEFPMMDIGGSGRERSWRLPAYGTILRVLKNPTYAGAYVYGRRETRVTLKGERIVKTKGHELKIKDWKILIEDHHPGYIRWEEYERNQATLLGNWKKMGGSKGPILKGRSLLAGLLRCRRCGRRLSVTYGGKGGVVPQYMCCGARTQTGASYCLLFGGMRVDEAVAREVLRVVEPVAIEASLRAVEEYNQRTEERQRLLKLELEQAEYEAERAYRQYNKAEPENRLVVSQLEEKWNVCLESVERTRARIAEAGGDFCRVGEEEKQELYELAEDLPRLWSADSTTNEIRKRIIRSAIEEIIADVDKERFKVVLNIHWKGGIHTELEVKKNRSGEHGKSTDKSIVELVRKLALQVSDGATAQILNRLRLRTGRDNRWTAARVRWLRHYNRIACFKERDDESRLTLHQASDRLGVCAKSVRNLIEHELLSADQVCPYAPWIIRKEELEKPDVKRAVKCIRAGLGWRNDASGKAQLELFNRKGNECGEGVGEGKVDGQRALGDME